VNLPGFFSEGVSNVFAVADDGLNQLSIERHGLGADWHQRRAAARGYRCAGATDLLRCMGGDCDGRRHASDLMAIALWAAHQMALKLAVEIVRTTEPAFELVIVGATKVVNNHLFNRGARDGNRTRTAKGREILSLLCLPISPPGRVCRLYRRPDMKKGKATGAFPFEFWSGRRVSNSRPQPWQGCALPTELLPRILEARAGVEPTYTDLQSGA
jgi:hypothetical protein